jgi:serine/threonine-protein kinase PknG
VITCQRNCPGTIEDGYCDTCGMAPLPASTAPGATATATAAASALSARTGGSARSGSTRTGSRRRRFGGGLVDVAPMPARDPSTAILAIAEVPEERRYCAKCTNPVGRTRGERAGRTSGFCPSCGEQFDFTPKLRPGELVGGQYEIAGPIAHGGLGWIYLAVDKNVSDRWVVLKGLLNSGDPDALAAAEAEQRFLAQVEHPNIVKIYNFVKHAGAGYIVMEYVGGESLKGILKDRRAANGNRPDPLPPAQALAYLIEVLPAFGYLHDRGLIFCDFKPDNVLQTGDQVKLIDLGGVVRLDDEESAIYGTVGFQAPEIARTGPTVASDIFTIGRTLAVLAIDFRGYQSTFRTTLPDRSEVELFRRFESLHRLLQRATHPDPGARFADVSELGEQMLGVLREVLAADAGPHPAPSRLFTGESRSDLRDDTPRWRHLPAPMMDLTDPAAGFLAAVTVSDPDEILTVLGTAPVDTIEVRLRALRAQIDRGARTGDFGDARTARDTLAGTDPADWRVAWYDGVLALAEGDNARAQSRFQAVYSCLPGELAPKLALGLALELAGSPAAAAEHYDVVSRTDPAYTTACAGLARCRLAGGDRTGAVEAYHRVPGTSAAYRNSQVGAVRALVRRHGSATADVAALAGAAALIDRLEADTGQLAALRAELLERALDTLTAGTAVPAAVLGAARTPTGGTAAERDVRFALEGCYREMARSQRGAERIRLVDLANATRPRTRT